MPIDLSCYHCEDSLEWESESLKRTSVNPILRA